MLFNSYIFLILFLPIVYSLTRVIKKFKNHSVMVVWLSLASLVFYGYWDVRYVPLIVFSIICNFGCGKLIKRNIAYAKFWLVGGVIFNLILLGYFKYTDMLIETLNRIISTQFDLLHIVLPIAMSFFTFEQIAYLVDTYRAKGRYHYRFIDYFLFVTFFPRLIAGPIIRHNEVLVQIRESFYYKINAQSLASGLSLFIMGLFKKLVISAYLAAQADILFQSTSNIGTLATWLGVLAFTLQIYFDFSSYSDMATGLAKMFGITLPMNFNSPYKALNVSEFWRQWNISLSRFLKDYLYIPLGGSRKGIPITMVNLMITMLLGGLWHGAAWTFVLWGALHGFYLIVFHTWRQLFCFNCSNIVCKLGAWLVTFFCVVIAWVPFRASSFDEAWGIYCNMFLYTPSQLVNSKNILLIASLVIVTVLLPNCLQLFHKEDIVLEIKQLSKLPNWLYWQPNLFWLMVIFVVSLVNFFNMGIAEPFIYFDF